MRNVLPGRCRQYKEDDFRGEECSLNTEGRVVDNVSLKHGEFDHSIRLVVSIVNETYGEFSDVVYFEIMKLNSRILKVDVPHWIECIRSSECIRGNNVLIPEDAPGSVKTAISKYLYPNGEIRPGYKKAVAKVLRDKAEFQYAQISHSGFETVSG